MDGRKTISTSALNSALSDEDTPAIAIFDLDYTLTRRGTWWRFVWSWWVWPRPYLWLPFLIAAGWAQLRYKFGLLPRDQVKLAMMRWAMKGASKEQVYRKGEAFARREVQKGLRDGAFKAIQHHKCRGDKLIIISAAVDVIAKPMGNLLGFDHVLSTAMSFDRRNKLQLKFKTPNCYSYEKVNRFKEMLVDNPSLKQYYTHVTFYSDSYSDLAMFKLANVCVCVHPDKKLSHYAAQRGWHILYW